MHSDTTQTWWLHLVATAERLCKGWFPGSAFSKLASSIFIIWAGFANDSEQALSESELHFFHSLGLQLNAAILLEYTQLGKHHFYLGAQSGNETKSIFNFLLLEKLITNTDGGGGVNLSSHESCRRTTRNAAEGKRARGQCWNLPAAAKRTRFEIKADAKRLEGRRDGKEETGVKKNSPGWWHIHIWVFLTHLTNKLIINKKATRASSREVVVR